MICFITVKIRCPSKGYLCQIWQSVLLTPVLHTIDLYVMVNCLIYDLCILVEATTLQSEVKVSNKEYHTGLANPSSPAFKQEEQEFCNQVVKSIPFIQLSC